MRLPTVKASAAADDGHFAPTLCGARHPPPSVRPKRQEGVLLWHCSYAWNLPPRACLRYRSQQRECGP